MCFSATASFGASAIIATISSVSLTKAVTGPQKILAFVPFTFAIQQFSEGILWLSLREPPLSQWNDTATYVFLVIAQVVWPVYVPLTVLLLEKERIPRKILTALLILGIIVAACLFYGLAAYRPQASISCSHIRYNVHYPIPIKHFGLLYLMATLIPAFTSSIKRLRLLGGVILVSFLFTMIFYQYYFISVWCYFAALISVIVLSVVVKLNKPSENYPAH